MIFRQFTNILLQYIIYKPKAVWGKRHLNSIKCRRLWSDIKKAVGASCISVTINVSWVILKELRLGKNPYTIHRETYLRTKCKEKNRSHTCSSLSYFQLYIWKNLEKYSSHFPIRKRIGISITNTEFNIFSNDTYLT